MLAHTPAQPTNPPATHRNLPVAPACPVLFPLANGSKALLFDSISHPKCN
jgi:hypothetical protein